MRAQELTVQLKIGRFAFYSKSTTNARKVFKLTSQSFSFKNCPEIPVEVLVCFSSSCSTLEDSSAMSS